MEGKVAVLGDADFVMPFSALGVDIFSVEESVEQISQKAKEIIDGGYALVVVAENVARPAQEVFADYQDAPSHLRELAPYVKQQ